MNNSSAAKPLSRAAARNCLVVNQFATPGLGSLMGRRFLAGAFQLALALAGFGFVIGWFVQVCFEAYHQFNDAQGPPQTHWLLLKLGAALFLTAWLLSWVTSLSLLRQAREQDVPRPPSATPPRL